MRISNKLRDEYIYYLKNNIKLIELDKTISDNLISGLINDSKLDSHLYSFIRKEKGVSKEKLSTEELVGLSKSLDLKIEENYINQNKKGYLELIPTIEQFANLSPQKLKELKPQDKIDHLDMLGIDIPTLRYRINVRENDEYIKGEIKEAKGGKTISILLETYEEKKLVSENQIYRKLENSNKYEKSVGKVKTGIEI